MASRILKSTGIYLEMIKFQHSVFALPFAMLGMLWAAGGWPGAAKFIWIVLAMVSCRSAAMAYNRIADQDIDALNPRTRSRAIPSGLIRIDQVYFFLFLSCGIFLLSAGMLNTLALLLSPIALGITLFYSTTKHFTPLSHFFLGLSLAIAPAAAWIGVNGTIDARILPIVGAVLLWTAGFDIIYSLQDEEFDRTHQLRSLPETLGKAKALGISRLCHFISIICLLLGGFYMEVGWIYYFGVTIAAIMLIYEQSLVRPNDLRKVNLAFFTVNGFVSIAIFTFSLIDWIIYGAKHV